MSGKQGHLALFIYDLGGGGAQRRTLTLANAFAERGFAVDLVVLRTEGAILDGLSPGVRLVRLPLPGTNTRLAKYIRRLQVGASIPVLARYLRRERPDVLLSAASHVNLAAVWGHRLARVPTAMVLRASNHLSRSAHNAKRPPRILLPLFARWFYPWADAIIAVSDDVARDLARVTGIALDAITTIPNPVVTPDMAARAAQPLHHPWFADGEPPVILGAGRLVKQKDFPTLVSAFARVRANRPARLMILGQGKKESIRRRLLDLAAALGVADDVALPGFVENPLPYMARSAVFVLSSAWEGLPGVIIEALACGCPVVATDSPGGAREILKDGAIGPLVPVGDGAAMASAILSLLDRPPERETLTARAADFGDVDSAGRYIDVLLGAREKVLSNG